MNFKLNKEENQMNSSERLILYITITVVIFVTTLVYIHNNNSIKKIEAGLQECIVRSVTSSGISAHSVWQRECQQDRF